MCEVPEEHVKHLLHQDRLAQRQDERMLEKTSRSYLVVRRTSGAGAQSNVAVRVDGMGILDGSGFDLARVNDNNMLQIR